MLYSGVFIFYGSCSEELFFCGVPLCGGNIIALVLTAECRNKFL